MNALIQIGISFMIVLFLTNGISLGQNTAVQLLAKGVEHCMEGNNKEATQK